MSKAKDELQEAKKGYNWILERFEGMPYGVTGYIKLLNKTIKELEAEKMELMAYIENIRNMAHEKYPHKDIIRSCEKALQK